MYGEGIVCEGILKDLQFDNYWGVSLPGKLAQETIDCIYPFEAKRRKMTEARRKNDINYMQSKNQVVKRDPIKDIQSYLDMMNKLNDPEEDKRKEILFRRF